MEDGELNGGAKSRRAEVTVLIDVPELPVCLRSQFRQNLSSAVCRLVRPDATIAAFR